MDLALSEDAERAPWPFRPNGGPSRGPSTLIQRNVSVGSHRTTVRLEPAMWDGLGEICRREGVSLNELCGRVAGRRSASSLTATIRVFVMSYFRAAATEDGHARTGHGLLYGEREHDRGTQHPAATAGAEAIA